MATTEDKAATFGDAMAGEMILARLLLQSCQYKVCGEWITFAVGSSCGRWSGMELRTATMEATIEVLSMV